MFRIKTDIRHYRCESRDKVERLIRNWVIRPSDLIYDDDADGWYPIGEHPEFVGLFDTLTERHENQPETIVTERAADKAATDRVMTNSGENSSASAPQAAVIRHKLSTSQGGSGTSGSAAVLEADEQSNELEPPEPSDEVVGTIRDSDEITLMTDRTLALMIEQRGDKSVAVETGEHEALGADEPTNRIARPAFDEESEDTADEPTNRIERPVFDDVDENKPVDAPPEKPEEHVGVVPGEPTNRIERPGPSKPAPQEGQRSGSAHAPSGPIPRSDTDDSNQDSTGGSLRDRLPEHLFTTAEVEPDNPDRHEVPETITSVADSILTIEPGDDDSVQLNADTLDLETEQTIDDGVDPLADTGEIDRPGLEASQESSGDTSDEAVVEISAEAIEEIEPGESEQELEEVEVTPVEEDVYDGYDVDYPIPVEPTEEAVELGIQCSSAPGWKQSRLFPQPRPKTAGEVVTAGYDLERRSDPVLPVSIDPKILIPAVLLVALILIVLIVAVVLFAL